MLLITNRLSTPPTTIFVRSTAFRCTNVYMHVRRRFATSLHRCRRRRRRRTTRSCLPRTPATDTHTLPLFVFIRRLFSLEMRESAADKKHPVYYRSPTPPVSQFGHITSRAPHPVRSAKLSGVEIGQYYGGGPHGKPGCRIFFYSSFSYFRVPFIHSPQLLRQTRSIVTCPVALLSLARHPPILITRTSFTPKRHPLPSYVQ